MTQAPSLEIRRLTIGDEDLMGGLLDLFAEVFEEPDTYARNRPSAAYHAELLDDERYIALVALNAGRVVGAMVSYVLRKAEQARSEVYIYDLAVARAHRRRGIATGLIGALKPIAADHGAHVIFVQADPPDAPAVALYDKLGQRQSVLHFDIPLHDGPRAARSEGSRP